MADTNGDPVDDEDEKTTDETTEDTEDTEDEKDDEKDDEKEDEGGSSSGGSSTGKTPDYTKQLKKLNDINDNLKKYLSNIEEAISEGGADYTEQLDNISQYFEKLYDVVYVKTEAVPAKVDVTPEEVKKNIGKCTAVYMMTHMHERCIMDLRAGQYDLDGDGIVTENDVKLAEEGQAKEATTETLIKVLLTISDNLKSSIQRNVYEEKDLFINLLAGQLFANTNFDYGNKNPQVEAQNSLNRAKVLANLLTFKK